MRSVTHSAIGHPLTWNLRRAKSWTTVADAVEAVQIVKCRVDCKIKVNSVPGLHNDYCVKVELPEIMDGLPVRKSFLYVEKGAML